MCLLSHVWQMPCTYLRQIAIRAAFPLHQADRRCIMLDKMHWMWLPDRGTDKTLEWRHNGLDSFSNHQPHDYLLIRLFRRRSKQTSKVRVTGLCEGNSAGTGEFPAQMASQRGKCFHLMTSWWVTKLHATIISFYSQNKPLLHYHYHYIFVVPHFPVLPLLPMVINKSISRPWLG